MLYIRHQAVCQNKLLLYTIHPLMWQKWSSFSPRATPNKRWAESVTESRWQLERKTEKKRTELFLFVLFSPEKPPAVMAFSSSSLAPHRHMSQRLSLQWRSVGPLAKRGLHTNPSTKAHWCSPTYRIMVGMHWGLGDEQECFTLLFWHTPQRAPPSAAGSFNPNSACHSWGD